MGKNLYIVWKNTVNLMRYKRDENTNVVQHKKLLCAFVESKWAIINLSLPVHFSLRLSSASNHSDSSFNGFSYVFLHYFFRARLLPTSNLHSHSIASWRFFHFISSNSSFILITNHQKWIENQLRLRCLIINFLFFFLELNFFLLWFLQKLIISFHIFIWFFTF